MDSQCARWSEACVFDLSPELLERLCSGDAPTSEYNDGEPLAERPDRVAVAVEHHRTMRQLTCVHGPVHRSAS